MVRRIEIGFASTEPDDVFALALELCRTLGDRNGGGRLYTLGTLG
jgi:hypothetical protein